MKTLKKVLFKIIVLVFCIIGVFDIVFVSITIWDCCNSRPENASKYTEEEHIERITTRVNKYYVECNQYPITDFEVFPIYDINDEFKYALVEFQPYGYVYVSIRDERFYNAEKRKYEIEIFALSTSMYLLSVNYNRIESPWSPSYIENGEIVFKEEEYYNSPFYVNNIENEKRYFIDVNPGEEGSLVPAVKREGKYINLYSNDEFELENGLPTSKQALSKRIVFRDLLVYNLKA